MKLQDNNTAYSQGYVMQFLLTLEDSPTVIAARQHFKEVSDCLDGTAKLFRAVQRVVNGGE